MSDIQTPTKPAGPSNFFLRTVTSLAMMISFLLLCLYVGQVACIFFILLLQVGMWHEVTNIPKLASKDKRPALPRWLNWYFLGICLYYLYGRALKKVLIKTWPDAAEGPMKVHTFTCFCLWCVGFVLFISSLRPKMLIRQFSQLVWNHMALLYIAVQGSFFIATMWDGMIWFLLPTSIIIANDIWAYICGKLFGRTKLWALSPKKTREGFIGAIVVTIVWGIFASWAFSYSPRLVCPKESIWPLTTPTSCDISPVFQWKEYQLPAVVVAAAQSVGLSVTTITVKPVMLHSISFSLFGSIVGPFGGFFASGIKRAFELKDFGDLIPGHGGVTDRMDCQMLMATFTYVYLGNFIRSSGGICSNPRFIGACVTRMSLQDQVELLNKLKQIVVSRGATFAANGTALLPAVPPA
eukprot:TRINITY_DN66413_c1_g1_i10.p1 TRINITY_DN66413_c1_g1~~TRINITY_DN66413_c1_g1_i10.p1  ORF type:complete len:438 (+),score=47.89 TRINITY_DN66413_c1_g1_i10:88-1314(+)